MSGRIGVAMAVALLVLPALAVADKAQPRGGGSSSSGASGRHPSSSSTKSSPSSSSSKSESSKSESSQSGSSTKTSAGTSASRSPSTAAQRRHPRPGTGTGEFDHSDHGYDYGYGYGWYTPYYGYAPGYYGYYGYAPVYYGYAEHEHDHEPGSGSLRILVRQPRAKVYVDGYYAGIVDDFDGLLQRLRVSPGRHDITLRLDGYRTQHFKVYVAAGDTMKIHHDMVKGTGEATSGEYGTQPVGYARFEGEPRDDPRAEPVGGVVRLDVRPGDASVYVDGEFRGVGAQAASLPLPAGPHRIEIVKPGYRTVEREVEVRAGETIAVEAALERN